MGGTYTLEALAMPGPVTSVIDRWATVSAQVPDRLALGSPGARYTFATADTLSDLLAAAVLNASGADPERPVAALMGHTATSIIAHLSVIKAGRVLVILDPYLPDGRLEQITGMARPSLYLTDSEHHEAARALAGPHGTVMNVDQPVGEALTTGRRASAPQLEALADARVRFDADDTLCLLFTSGSTGRPKGVQTSHRQWLNDAFVARNVWGISPEDRCTLVFPTSYAAGLSQMFFCLLNGASLWCYDPRRQGIAGLERWISDHELTTLHCTPFLLRSLQATLEPDRILGSLRFVASAGEAIHSRHASALSRHLRPDAYFYNWSGATEVGILGVHQLRADEPVPPGNLPTGLIVPNRTAQVVRPDGSPADPGEVGELVVTSHFLSNGYHDDPENNARRFGVDLDGRTVYRPGDFGRFDPEGRLTLLGRVDSAVKIRGYLVDPSEIESALLAIDTVTEAAVITNADSEAPLRLVAYVVQDPALPARSLAALRRELRRQLPEHMVPGSIVLLPSLPYSERGKLDRQSLPAPSAAPPSPAPATDREIVIAQIWRDILGLDSIGADQDFLALGGDSLALEEMLWEINQRFELSLTSADLLEAPTLHDFTARVEGSRPVLPRHADVIALRPPGAGTPLFCFAGGGGLALAFLPLSKRLQDRAVYSFQQHGLERRAVPDYTIEAAAERHLEVLRILQPSGPYVVVGHSFGGLVAFHVASRLMAAGETVALLGLLDTHLPATLLQGAGLQRAGREPTPVRGSQWAPVAGQVRQLWADRPTTLGGLRGRIAARARARAAGVLQFDGQAQFDAFFDLSKRVGRRYRPEPYPGRTLLVLANENPSDEHDWEPLLDGPTTVAKIPCEHNALLREPYVAQLADALQAALEEVPAPVPAAN